MKTLKRLGLAFAAATALVVGPYLVLLAINRHDQPPSQTVREFEQALANRPVVADTDNAYLMALGFAAPPSADPLQVGVARRDWIVATAVDPATDPSDDPLPEDHDYQSRRTPAVKTIADRCGETAARCFDAVDADPVATAQWLATEDWLLERYKSLIGKPAFLQAVDILNAEPWPRYMMILDGQRLFFVSTYLHAADGSYVRRALDRDLAFWRMVLANSDLLITKLIAAAAIKHHFGMGNEVVRASQARTKDDAIPELWLTAIDKTERSLRRPFIGEWRYVENTMTRLTSGLMNPLTGNYSGNLSWPDRAVWRLLLPLWQPQDFSNRQAAILNRLTELFDVPYASIPDALAKSADVADGFPWRFGGAFNLTGRLLQIGGYSHFGEYFVRVSDLEGVRRAALLTALMREKNTPPESITEVLRDTELTNPYTGEPFDWSPETDEVVFVGLEKGPRGEYRFRY